MKKMTEKEFIMKLLSEEAAQAMLKELELLGMKTEVQAEALAMVSDMIGEAIYLAIGTNLPESAREEYQELVGNGDTLALQKFLAPHIADLDAVIQEAARTELAAVKAGLTEQFKRAS